MTIKHLSPRRVAATIALLTLGLAVFVPLPMSASSESACEALARWATEYERETPAPTLDELAKFDRGRRIAIFNAVGPEVKASLFREQLRRFSERPDLTPTQRALIAEGLTLITPAAYRKDPAARQAARHFWSRAESSFISLEQRRPWLDIGTNLAPQLAISAAVSGGDGTCFCNFWVNDCGGGPWNCFPADCTYRPSGCGPIGIDDCNGECFYSVPNAVTVAFAGAGR